MEAGRIAAGSGRAWATPQRLDPFSLPVRFEAADEAADGRRRIVDLHRERVVLRRSVRGMLHKNTLGRQMLGKLQVYAGPDHPHSAQKPETLELPQARLAG